MTAPRHRRTRPHARTRRIGLIAAPILIVSSAATAVAISGSGDKDTTAPTASPERLEATISTRAAQKLAVSRSETGGRVILDGTDPTNPRDVDTSAMFATASLNVWSGPGERFKRRTVLDEGAKLAITGLEVGKWTQIVYQGKFGWVNAAYVDKKKPEITEETADAKTADAGSASTTVTEAPCRLGTGVEAGLTSGAIRVYRSVCAEFPEVTSYGGLRPGDSGEHGTGRALDIMATGSLGDAIAAYVRANASKLGVSEVLWAQQIWTVERGSEGWRGFADRGSATANHFDHVHVTVYGP